MWLDPADAVSDVFKRSEQQLASSQSIGPSRQGRIWVLCGRASAQLILSAWAMRAGLSGPAAAPPCCVQRAK